MNHVLQEKAKEALSSVLPITFIILLLSATVTPMPLDMLVLFLVGTVMLIFGTALFSLGTDMAMTPMGEGIGAQLPKTRNIGLICLITFLIGVLITMAEPDLQVLATQVPSIPNMTLVLTVALGVGGFFVVAVLRTLFGIPLSRLLVIFYAFVFLLSIFVPKDFIAMAFDSGGVTTGPITVPFIMAMGVGLASIRSDRGSQDDSFGLVALCSVGPILAVLILGVCFHGNSALPEETPTPLIETAQDVAVQFASNLPHYVKEVVIALLPILFFCVIFQLLFRRFTNHQLRKISIGFLYTFVGLAIFLTGVNVGFMPAGRFLGGELAKLKYNWLLVPLSMVIGYFIVTAEPAVHVLNKQVESITDGGVSQRSMMLSLSIGVAISLGLSMVRVLTGISIYWLLIPGYILAVGLTFFVPKMFTGIAFDSGGVASGPLTTTFLLPFAMGACEAVGGNVLTDAFGIVSMVAMTPLITIQLLGLLHALRTRSAQADLPVVDDAEDDDIIEIKEGSPNV
ncbi:MAG: DUF1538 domain-containing protein [Ruminococcaceae bacterium]|nr:DUF1538 domain-containing protein [Oscillospiraceae bacterium]